MAIVNKISIYQADILKSLALFYLLILGNFITGLFTCHQKNFIVKNKWIQLIIAFGLFYFLVTLVSDTGDLEYFPPIQKLLYTFVYFFIFILSMRLDFRVMIGIILLVVLIYFIELNKDYYLELGDSITDKDGKKTYEDHLYWITLDYPIKIRLFPINPDQFKLIDKLEKVIFYLIIIFLILGIIAYRGEITLAMHKKTDLSWFEVFNDTHECKISERLPFLHYVRIGLGMNKPSVK